MAWLSRSLLIKEREENESDINIQLPCIRRISQKSHQLFNPTVWFKQSFSFTKAQSSKELPHYNDTSWRVTLPHFDLGFVVFRVIFQCPQTRCMIRYQIMIEIKVSALTYSEMRVTSLFRKTSLALWGNWFSRIIPGMPSRPVKVISWIPFLIDTLLSGKLCRWFSCHDFS